MVEPRKRERKTVERFVPEAAKENAKTVVPEGNGTKLSDIPNVCFKLDKLKGTDEQLEHLHTVLFKSKGKALSRKKDIKAFSGLVYEGDEAEEAKKVEARLSKLTAPQLHAIMDVLDIARGSDTKEKKAGRVVKFLEKPEVLNEKNLKEQAETKKAKAADKKAKEVAKKEKATAAKKAKAEKASDSKKPKAGSAKKEKTTPAVVKKPTKKAAPEKSTSAKKATPAKKTPKKASAEKEAPKTTRKRKAADAEEKPAKKAKKGVAGAKIETWPDEEQLTKDIAAIVEDKTGGDGYIRLGAVYTALGSKYGLSKEEMIPKRSQVKSLLSKFQEPSEEPEAETGEKMEVDEPTAEVETGEKMEVDEPTPEPQVPDAGQDAAKTVGPDDATPNDLEEPAPATTVPDKPEVKEPEPVQETVVEQAQTNGVAQPEEVSTVDLTAVSDAVPTVEEPISVNTSLAGPEAPVQDVVTNETTSALPEPLITEAATTEGDEQKPTEATIADQPKIVEPQVLNDDPFTNLYKEHLLAAQPAAQPVAPFDPDAFFNFDATTK